MFRVKMLEFRPLDDPLHCLVLDVQGLGAVKPEEKIAIASDHLLRLPLDAPLRNRYREWRRYERANAVLAALRGGRLGRALRHALAGFAGSFSWAAYLPYRLAHAVATAVYRRLKAG